MGRIIYLTGPVRSGKSRRAVELGTSFGPGTVFVATYRLDPGDGEMKDRVARHQAERPASWRTLEAPPDVAKALAALSPAPDGVVLDCLTLWLGDRMDQSDAAILEAWRDQLDAFAAGPCPVVIVGNELGWSPVPEEPSLRRFRDLAGWLGQATAAAAAEAWLFVAGCGVRLK
jgi:adenosylcobinamide kinase/adenosylcobinamide-phosphate guanylyltransferase